MNEYSSLALLISQRRLPGPLLLMGNEQPQSAREKEQAAREQQLIQLLITLPESEQTTVQLTKRVFGANTTSNRVAFNKLVNRVRPKLLNNLYFLDHSDELFKRSRRYEAELLDLLHKAKLLYLAGEHKLLEPMMLRVLREAQLGGFTMEAIQAAMVLSSLYVNRGSAFAEQYQKIDAEVEQLRQQLNEEIKADRTYQRIFSGLNYHPAAKSAMLAEMPLFIEELASAYQRHPQSFVLFERLYQVRMQFAETEERYDDIFTLTILAGQQADADEVKRRRFDIRYNQYWTIYAALRSGNLQNALQLAPTYAKNFHQTSTNWFYFYRYWILAALYVQNYKLAQQLMGMVRRNTAKAKLDTYRQEQWLVLEAYVGYTELHPSPQTQAQLRQLATAGYASQVITKIRRNKTVDNVDILLFRLMYQLREGDVENAPKLSESLRKYHYRHLRGRDHARTHIFLRLLRLAAVALENNTVAELRKKGERLRTLLVGTPLPGTAELELIPLEQLWELTVQGMERVAKRTRGA